MQNVAYEFAFNYRYIFGLDESYPALDLQITTDHGSTSVVAVLDTGAMRTVLICPSAFRNKRYGEISWEETFSN